MKHLTTVLLLVLASTKASKYFRPENHFQQDSTGGEVLNLSSDNENRFLPRLEGMTISKWVPPANLRTMFLTNLEALDNFLEVNKEDPEETRMKRMKASLSIDNPLDVLRQQYYRALARRMKFKSIEKNREHLIKTGKRSSAEKDPIEYEIQGGKSLDFQNGKRAASEKNFIDNGEIEKYSIINRSIDSSSERNPESAIYKTRLEGHSYQK